MSRHPSFTDEAPKTMDIRLMGRLVGYVKPYWFLMLLSLIFLAVITVGELIPPLLTRQAIDRYIVPEWGVVSGEAPVEDLGRAEHFALARGGYMVRITDLSQAERRVLEARSLLSPERYVLVPQEAVEKLSPSDMVAAGEGRFITLNKLRNYDKSVISQVRAKDLSGIGWVGLLLFLVLSVNLIFNFAQVYTLQLVSQKSMADLRQDIFQKYLRSPVEFFTANPIGRLVTRATNDVASINEFFSSVLIYLVKDVLLIAGIIIILIRMNLRLTGVLMVLVPFLVVATFLFRRFAREAYREVRKYLAQVNASLQESISGVAVIQAFVQESRMFREFKGINHRLYKAFIKQIYVFGTFRPLMDLADALAVALILWYGGGEIIRGGLSFGALVAFISYVEMLFQPIRDLSEKYNIMQSAFAASERIFKILDGPEEPRGGAVHLPEIKGHIVFENVWFSYKAIDTRTLRLDPISGGSAKPPEPAGEEWVLRDVSFEVKPGQTVALVGPTGAGKTSIIKLLLRFHDPQKGRILLDGVDIRDLALDDLRRHTALVQQDIFVFSGTVASNIRLKSPIPEERVREAARAVDADRFIEQLPDAYNARLGERGATLSQGQRQLLAFARALAFDPRILILDEATANVDQETEEIIQASMKKLLAGRTALVVAHRLSTIRDADLILVIQKGKVVEQGTHRELLAKKGFYYYLHGLQFAGTRG